MWFKPHNQGSFYLLPQWPDFALHLGALKTEMDWSSVGCSNGGAPGNLPGFQGSVSFMRGEVQNGGFIGPNTDRPATEAGVQYVDVASDAHFQWCYRTGKACYRSRYAPHVP